jgi:hypothetical protein
MKKAILLFFTLLLTHISGFSQIVLKGTVQRYIETYKVGDTIEIFGYRKNEHTLTEQYLINRGHNTSYVNTSRVKLIDAHLPFWDSIWFYNRGAHIKTKGWERAQRTHLNEDALDYYRYAMTNHLIFKDELLYDYIYQLLHKIHPEGLIKGKSTRLTLAILKSTSPESFSFDNGLIVITTGLLASTRSEDELVRTLTNCIAHITLEHNLINLNFQLRSERIAAFWRDFSTVVNASLMAYDHRKNGTLYHPGQAAELGNAVYFISHDIRESIGANYSLEQNLKVSDVSTLYGEAHQISLVDSDKEYIRNISSAISLTAWQEFNSLNFPYAFSLVDKLNTMKLATEEDFLLLAKLSRKSANTPGHNNNALHYLEEAKKFNSKPMAEIFKEEGIIHLRNQNLELAKVAFSNYLNILKTLQSQGIDVEEEIKNTNNLLYRHGL